MAKFELEDEDSQPLVCRSTSGNANGGAFESLASGKRSAGSNKSESSFVRRNLVTITSLLVVCIVAVFYFNKQDEAVDASDVTEKNTKPIRKRDCPRFCLKRNEQFSQKWGVDLLDTSSLLARAEQEREKVVKTLKKKYGKKYFPKLFTNEQGESVGRYGFKGPKAMPFQEKPVDWKEDVSRHRFLRKLMIKILKMQLAVEQEAKNVQGCDCRKMAKGRMNQLRLLQDQPSNATKSESTTPDDEEEGDDGSPDFYERFVWLNAGHSSGAGHGNRHNETYTAIMEATAKAAFMAVGIDLEGRNYGMGGMSSSPELALCNEAVYGTDPDLMTWNFGMTDGNKWWRHYMFGYRRAMNRNRPVLLDIEFGELDKNNPNIKIMEVLEDSGLSTLHYTESAFYEDQLKDGIPDMFGMNQQEIDATPEYLRYFRCGGKLEKGDPGCDDHKYTDECAPHKAGWHPGWKANALGGNMMALMMIDGLIDALKELDAFPVHDAEEMLDHYQNKENEDYEKFLNTPLTNSTEFLSEFWNENITRAGVDASLLFQKPSFCRTGLLPADSRYKGIMFDKYEHGSYMYGNYEFGVKREDANKRNATDESTMQLTYDDKEDCPILSAIDYKDYYLVTHNDGESTLTIPNKAEQEVYLEGLTDGLQGLIMLSLTKCDWGKCPEGDMKEDQVNGGNITLTVNGERVVEMVPFETGNQVLLLRHKEGFFWKTNERDQYDLTARVLVPGGYFRIASVILI